MWVFIVSPAPPGARTGNETTTDRWRRLLEKRGQRVEVATRWNDEPCDVLIALHAHKSGDSIHRFHEAHPDRPLIVALTGTDLYEDLTSEPETWRAVSIATRLVVLQPLAVEELPEPARGKCRVIYQSVPRIAAPHPARDPELTVCVLAHLRAIKDPFRAALASRRLPPDSRIRIVSLGGALEPGMESAARAEEEQNPRYRWLGSVPREEALSILASSQLMVNSSIIEGGANAVGEALVASVPVIASRIPGNVGLLGEDYPGYFPAGDDAALAELLLRCERDPAFLATLESRCRDKQELFEPRREEEAWVSLLSEALTAARDTARTIEVLSQIMRASAEAGADDGAGKRRVPRLDVEGWCDIELWPRGPAGAQPLVLPVELQNMSPEGFAAVLDRAGISGDGVAMVSVRLPGSSLIVPGRITWSSAAGDTEIGVHFQLTSGDHSEREAYTRWMIGFLRARGFTAAP
jgi:putative glycosyltransferase (TIGR04348 family)